MSGDLSQNTKTSSTGWAVYFIYLFIFHTEVYFYFYVLFIHRFNTRAGGVR